MTGPALQTFTASLAPEFSSLVTTLDETIHSAAALDSAIKWRQLTYAVNGDYHHWICAINVTKKQVSLRFHFGGLLSDPEGVFRVGESKWMRSLDFKPGEAVDTERVRGFVSEAVGKREYFKQNWKRLQGDV